MRHSTFKKYFDRYKWNKKKRELLMQIIANNEEQAAEILSPSGEFTPFLDAVPEVKAFLADVEAKEKLLIEQKGTTIVHTGDKDGESEGVEEIAFNPEKFNPFDRKTTKEEEKQEKIKPKQARKVLTVKKQ